MRRVAQQAFGTDVTPPRHGPAFKINVAGPGDFQHNIALGGEARWKGRAEITAEAEADTLYKYSTARLTSNQHDWISNTTRKSQKFTKYPKHLCNDVHTVVRLSLLRYGCSFLHHRRNHGLGQF